ncbi:ribosome maturation factor RimM [Cohnella cholangitidis]|uniref:Ribosome maturation factor RimM n=1 Tax=Cohnella cholangitidis TaxID=2598458 RepID=A0A7G5BTB5_9BACL|nr:ribosome maturation factor RimM [Cohnella cholangitidis]QMV40199.1 ribosome maturation factor RimM [Cohnella cholangitidis]
MSDERLLNIGKIVNTHGIKGELKIYPQTDFPEVRFQPGSKLLMVPPESGEPIAIEIAAAREQKTMYVVKIKGFDNINQVEKYKGWELKVTESERVPLSEGEYYFRDIIGCEVITEEGETLGTVKDILSPGANDVWVVKMAKGKELLLPVIDDVVLDVDVAGRKIKVHLMEGLL